ncbi:MAG TPA: helicase-associated domain-containing protein, partial [Roseiflexaceae bacterium]|nr:helicase-associated domain-containing protein [Roseiflexaceae bacterium]
WLVQPDFEVVVYLDRAAAEQIAFMERHAERLQAQQHIARYQLTREAIYQGLESGTAPDQLLERLQAGAATELPQNVLATIREWAGQREKITLRRATSLLEFADPAARQAALDSGLAGRPVGERFVLLTETKAKYPANAHVDYTRPLPASLVALEDGRIKQVAPAVDLLLQPRLERWAERAEEGSWRLTQSSVAAAIKAKLPIEELFELLRARLTRPMPPLLGVALRAWAGDRPRVELATITVLRCTRPVVFSAIANSPAFKAYLRGTLAPDLLLVDERYLEPLKEQLAWAGLDLADVLELK